jgi:hypothetical protein
MFAGAFGSFSQGDKNQGANYEDEYKKSFLSDIKSFFGSISYKGGVGGGGLAGMGQIMLS